MGIDQKIRSEMFQLFRKRGYNAEAFDGKMPTYVFDGYPDAFAGSPLIKNFAVI
ncbi:hypothetical protein H6801_02435 [Candidatus Nomurabacteria bacterium]|nr:hypothetical protein [Candidatus Nomurabacteria bacterium]